MAYFLALILGFCLSLSGCSKKGPAEKAGETIDDAAKKVKDAVTPEGPAEKVGKKIDKAVKEATD